MLTDRHVHPLDEIGAHPQVVRRLLEVERFVAAQDLGIAQGGLPVRKAPDHIDGLEPDLLTEARLHLAQETVVETAVAGDVVAEQVVPQIDQPLQVAGVPLETSLQVFPDDRVTEVHALPHFSAQQLTGRHPLQLAVEVVERQVDGRGQVGVAHRAGEVLRPQELVDLPYPGGVPSDQQLVVARGDGAQVVGQAVRRLPQSHEPVIDVKLDDDVACPFPCLDRVFVVIARGFDLEGFDFRNFHFCLS